MEKLLHYIWKYGLFFKEDMQTQDGQPVEIINPGFENTDEGPDFSKAVIQIGRIKWVGNIEIHTRSSDWIAHSHQNNPAYNNVILHVVQTYDKPIFRDNGEEIPCLILRFPNHLYERIQAFITSPKSVACEDYLSKIKPLNQSLFLTRLFIERLNLKVDSLTDILHSSSNDFQAALYQSISRSFGMNINTYPFEALTERLPYSILLKHKDNLLQLEALLFGMSGILGDLNTPDPYINDLQREFTFLSRKYKLSPIDAHLWKYLRLRPVNFPEVRIAQLASLIQKGAIDLSYFDQCTESSQMREKLQASPSHYWQTHYTFRKESRPRNKALGEQAQNNLLINTILPLLFLYRKLRGKPDIEDSIIKLYESLPPEQNRITQIWEQNGWKIDSAFDSQAIIQLYKNYCSEKNCTRCDIGHHLFRC